MNFMLHLIVIFGLWHFSSSLEVDIKGDPCLKFDSCYANAKLRTCSCEDDCFLYGTCCHDSPRLERTVADKLFQCYSQRVINPVYVKRSCPDDFKIPVYYRENCLEDDVDEGDVVNNLLVTSRKTRITYWNYKCAKCNREKEDDLLHWNIEVLCPPKMGARRYEILRNLTYDDDKKIWGLNLTEEFVQCSLKFTPPHYVDELQYCPRRLISDCPDDFPDKDISEKCSQYYGQRKFVDNGEVEFFKNIHCAICNDLDVVELQCEALRSSKQQPGDPDLSEMAKVVFSVSEWKNRNPEKKYHCSRDFLYNPFKERCARNPARKEVITTETVAENAAKVLVSDVMLCGTLTALLLLV